MIAMKVQARMTPFLSVFIYVATLESGREWARENEIIVPNSSSVSSSLSSEVQNYHPSSPVHFQKTSERNFFNFSRFEPGRSSNFSLSPSISLEDTFNVLASVWYNENSTRSKERESLILTKEETNAH